MMRNLKKLTLTAALTVLSGQAMASPEVCALNRISVDGAEFKILVADNDDKRSQGLMNISEMPDWAGMLFVFPSVVEVSFWMKNTLIPLDMIFIDEHGEVLKVHENAEPHDLTSIRSDHPVKYVLEINGGLSASLGIEAGDQAISLEMGNCSP
jgi:uncharacterized membrane protein (UPF0127 family)